MKKLSDKFDISNKVCIIAGGSGLLGKKHVEAVLEGGGIPVILGRTESKLLEVVEMYDGEYTNCVEYFCADITQKSNLEAVRDEILQRYGHIDILINNAANNPKMEGGADNMKPIQFENFPIDLWNEDLNVGITGAFLCAQVFGSFMAAQREGVILNISSDYGLLAPDQRIYRQEGLSDDAQLVKPVSYSVVKHALGGLTKYLATYWGEKGVRTNTLCPSGIINGQDALFISKFIRNVPLGRMSTSDEYTGTILYMISDASSFMNGATIVIDGGKSIW